MKQWFLIYYNEDMDRCTKHFEMDVTPCGIPIPTKSMIQNLLGIDLYSNWTVSEIKG